MNFLIDLAQGPPNLTTRAHEPGHVAVLEATGLIEATLDIPPAPPRCARSAFVRPSTKEREQEIAAATGRKSATADWHHRNCLALEYLHILEKADFPVIVKQKEEFESAAMLLGAGLIHGVVQEHVRPSVIRGLTEVGREFFSRRYGKAAIARAPSSRAVQQHQTNDFLAPGWRPEQSALAA
ncbi:hypothetical protein [Variovorax sp. OK605]|uniref:hypothetical protein n=1 Tax=Variovorax sp. OK605 TaxID=1855317 RepID=UPI0011605E36|nr:hypothetical protein [Variovorax sp. OK605]